MQTTTPTPEPTQAPAPKRARKSRAKAVAAPVPTAPGCCVEACGDSGGEVCRYCGQTVCPAHAASGGTCCDGGVAAPSDAPAPEPTVDRTETQEAPADLAGWEQEAHELAHDTGDCSSCVTTAVVEVAPTAPLAHVHVLVEGNGPACHAPRGPRDLREVDAIGTDSLISCPDCLAYLASRRTPAPVVAPAPRREAIAAASKRARTPRSAPVVEAPPVVDAPAKPAVVTTTAAKRAESEGRWLDAAATWEAIAATREPGSGAAKGYLARAATARRRAENGGALPPRAVAERTGAAKGVRVVLTPEEATALGALLSTVPSDAVLGGLGARLGLPTAVLS